MATVEKLYELNNDQRKYFGLLSVEDSWDKQQLSSTIYVYFDQHKIVKILNYGWGYVEYDTDISTIKREILVPKTTRGKEQKLTIPRILKMKGSGVQFSGSFQGGNIHVYDNKRNLFFIKSYPEDGDMKNYEDIDNWISNYIANVPCNHIEWLTDQLTQRMLRIKIEAGNFIAFKLTQTEFGFARILSNIFEDRKRNFVEKNQLYWFHPRSLIVAPYAFFASTQNVNIEELLNKPTLPTVCIFDIDIYRGEMPIIGHKPLSETEKQIPFPNNGVTSATLNVTKRGIETLMNDSRL
jgi:immunity protein 26 of polymorphic toxin system